MSNNKNYNGWKNRQTWNVALWIQNDEGLYTLALEHMKHHDTSRNPYISFIHAIDLQDSSTPDNVPYISDDLDYRELRQMMLDLVN